MRAPISHLLFFLSYNWTVFSCILLLIHANPIADPLPGHPCTDSVQQEKDISSIAKSPYTLEIWVLPKGQYACRVPAVCIQIHEGMETLTLPHFLDNPRAEKLLNLCTNIPRPYKFHTHKETAPPYDPASWNASTIVNLQNDSWIPQHHDLYRPSFKPRYHMPHFMEDVSPYWYTLERLFNPDNLAAYDSYSAFDFYSTSYNGKCSTKPPLPAQVVNRTQLIVPLQERLARPSFGDECWVKMLLRSFVSRNFGPMKFIYDAGSTFHHVRTAKGGLPLCYRSVFFPPKYENYLNMDVISKSASFSNLGVPKTFRAALCTDRPTGSPLGILIQNRENTRNISNLVHLIQEIRTAIDSLEKIDGHKIVADIFEEKFENMSFVNQVKTMVRTDIMVAAHGAGITNGIFMRPGSLVIDYFPWSYYAAVFYAILNKHHITYISMISTPAIESMRTCVFRGTRNKEDIERAEKIMEMLHESANQRNLIPGLSKLMSPDKRHCFRHQAIFMDPYRVKKVVSHYARDYLCLPTREKGQIDRVKVARETK